MHGSILFLYISAVCVMCKWRRRKKNHKIC